MFDDRGILGQHEGNGVYGGGDALNFTGMLVLVGGSSIKIYNTFRKGFGALSRHPTEGYSSYYKHPWDGRISRDQLTGALAGMIAQRDRVGVLKVFIHHAAWLWLFAYNTRKNGDLSKWKWPDITGPDIWAMYIRGLLGKAAYLLFPILCAFDLMLIANAYTVLKNNDGHVTSHLAKLITALETAPTPIARLAFKMTSKDWLLASLTTYWCGFRDKCFMVELYKRKLDELK